MQSAIAHHRRIMTVALAAISLMLPLAAAASTNDMIAGGCSTRASCTQKIAASDLQSFYAAHGVTAATLHDSVNGTVTSHGDVLVDGKAVATGAQSFGRRFISGSTQVGPVFRRPTSVSFQSNSLSALVFEPNGHFAFAILKSCGNLVIATPMAAAPVHHAKAAPAPVVKNVVIVTNINNNTNTNQIPPATVAATPTPTPNPTPHPVVATPAAAVAPLPQTGASAIGLAGLSTLLVVAGYYWRSRRGLRFALLRG